MSNNSKNKGKAFERVVAKHLQSVFDLSFLRVPNSGAFCGGANSFRVQTISSDQHLLVDGDIIVPKQLSPFSFECKSYKDISWSEILYKGGNSHIDKWIVQAAQTKKPFWFIIFKINRQGEFVVMPSCYQMMWDIKVRNHIFFKNNSTYVLTPMENFFEDNKETIMKLGEKFNDSNTWNK
jgi:hypothetical protein